MSSKLPPVPPSNRSKKGTGEASQAKPNDAHHGMHDAPIRTSRASKENLQSNTTHQGHQQDARAPRSLSRRQVHRSGTRLDHDLGQDAPDIWADEFEQILISDRGGYAEVAFFQKASRTLALTDLVQNLEPEKLPVPMRPFAHLAGITAPDGRAPIYLRATIKMNEQEARESANRLVALRPERVISGTAAGLTGTEAARSNAPLRGLLKPVQPAAARHRARSRNQMLSRPHRTRSSAKSHDRLHHSPN